MKVNPEQLISAVIHANNLAGDANAAYWLAGIDADRAEFLSRCAIENLEKLAASLGFEVKENEQ